MEKGRMLQWHQNMDNPRGQASGSPQRPALGDGEVPRAEEGRSPVQEGLGRGRLGSGLQTTGWPEGPRARNTKDRMPRMGRWLGNPVSCSVAC